MFVKWAPDAQITNGKNYSDPGKIMQKGYGNSVAEYCSKTSNRISCFFLNLERVQHFLNVRKQKWPLRWRHNGCDSVSNHQLHHCLLNRLFRRRSKKASKLRVTGLCAGNSPGTGEFPAQMASYAKNVSIWWRHHATSLFQICGMGYMRCSYILPDLITRLLPSYYLSDKRKAQACNHVHFKARDQYTSKPWWRHNMETPWKKLLKQQSRCRS